MNNYENDMKQNTLFLLCSCISSSILINVISICCLKRLSFWTRIYPFVSRLLKNEGPFSILPSHPSTFQFVAEVVGTLCEKLLLLFVCRFFETVQVFWPWFGLKIIHRLFLCPQRRFGRHFRTVRLSVRPSIRPSRFVSGGYILYSLRQNSQI